MWSYNINIKINTLEKKSEEKSKSKKDSKDVKKLEEKHKASLPSKTKTLTVKEIKDLKKEI